MYQVTSSIINTAFECKQTGVLVKGSITKDELTDEIQSVSGSCYRSSDKNEMGEHFGTFNGTYCDGELKFSLSKMNRKDSNLTWGAIEEIEVNLPSAKNN